MAKVTKESVYEEIEKAGEKGKTFRNEEKKSFSQGLLREGRIKKVGKRYYSPEFAPTAEMVYQRIEKAGKDGIALKEFEVELIKPLIHEGRIKKIEKAYYAAKFAPTAEMVYQRIEKAGKDGIALKKHEVELIKPLIQEGKIKYVYKKHYLSKFSPLKQKEVVEYLLSSGKLKCLGKTYFILIEDDIGPPPVEIPSFLEFAKKVQEIYLRMAGEYKQSVKIMRLTEELISKMDISKTVAEKWILELPRIFLGRVDLRPFPGEKGLKMENGSEVTRIYLERGIVGL
ncbi:MAG: hypothetical protein AYK19_16020 [Theionarchaea archaeon DG-70-1]|nr:MAG: hypothetical protein AYK19_16020 [Theionarchaea archaeon DG-70-1]